MLSEKIEVKASPVDSEVQPPRWNWWIAHVAKGRIPERFSVFCSSFREWCVRNGPVFDFISKVVVASCTVVIAFYAATIATTQLAIQQSQLQVQELQARAQSSAHLPSIRFSFELKSTSPRIDDLLVANVGGEVFSLRVELLEFWYARELRLIWPDGTGPRNSAPLRRVFLPIHGAFSPVSESTGLTQGDLIRFRGESSAAWAAASEQFEHLIASETRSVASERVTFARVDFVNKFGEADTQYFAIGLTGMRPITVDVGNELERRYAKVSNKNRIDFLAPNVSAMVRQWTEFACADGCDDAVTNAVQL